VRDLLHCLVAFFVHRGQAVAAVKALLRAPGGGLLPRVVLSPLRDLARRRRGRIRLVAPRSRATSSFLSLLDLAAISPVSASSPAGRNARIPAGWPPRWRTTAGAAIVPWPASSCYAPLRPLLRLGDRGLA
jgi:hypothetical protein